MTNLKNVFNAHINKDEIYDNVIQLKRSKKVIRPVFVGVVVLLIFCGFMFINSNNETDRIVNEAGYASWNTYHDSDEELIDNSSLIGTGKVVSVKSERRVDMVFTIYTIKFDKIYKKESGFTGNKVKVLFTGGVYENYETTPFKECPLLEKNQKYLFFLENTPEDHYLIAGGYQGIAYVDDNIISFRNEKTQKLYTRMQNTNIKELDNIINDIIDE